MLFKRTFLSLLVLLSGLYSTSSASQVLTVPAKPLNTIDSSPLADNTLYLIEARGTYTYNNTSNPKGIADAEWSFHINGSSPDVGNWAEKVYEPPPGDGHLDLLINNRAIDWFGSTNGTDFSRNTFSPDHKYRSLVVGNGNPASFRIHDDPGAVGNEGSLEVEITSLGSVNKHTQYVVQQEFDTIPLLAEWIIDQWVEVTPNSLATGDIHVLTHGWGQSEGDDIDVPVWELDTDFFKGFNAVTSGILSADSTDRVVAYSWIDESGTDGFFPADAIKSKSKAKDAGHELATALKNAGVSSSNRIHLLGHSHGAKVSTIAAIDLENSGIEVDHLTLMDSPEFTNLLSVKALYAGAFNSLDSDLEKLDIGHGPDETFVDNYVSWAGRSYEVSTNVALLPSVHNTTGIPARHGYPLDWYPDAYDTSFGISWSPLIGGSSTSHIENYYVQDLNDRKKLNTITESIVDFIKNPLYLLDLKVTGVVVNVTGGKILQENSPAYWDSLIDIEQGSIAVELQFEFLNTGDGDELGLWINDELRQVITGNVVGNGLQSVIIDVSDLEPGPHLLSVALHSTGDANAEVFVGNFQSISIVPEPTSFVLALIAGSSILSRGRRSSPLSHRGRIYHTAGRINQIVKDRRAAT